MARCGLIVSAVISFAVGLSGTSEAAQGQAAVVNVERTSGVTATAEFSYTTSTSSGTSFLSTSTSSTSTDDAGYDVSSTYTPTEAPEQDAFSAGYYVDIPNPCVRRKFGGNYCEAAAPTRDAPNAPDRSPGRQAPPPPSPEEIARIAIDRAIALAPSPQLEVAPGRIGLTGLESYFWLAERPEPMSASAGVPGLTVVARAVPAQFVWDFGDGEDFVTSDAGSPSRSGSGISHLYETKGVYDLSVDVIWEASYSVNGGPWTSIGFFSTSDARSYPVREVIAVLTDG